MSMAVQTSYGEPSRGMPGLLVDRADYNAVTRRNAADTGKMFFGYGVVQGDEPGKNIALPATGATAATFEGVVMYSANVEMDDDGAVLLRNGQILDVCNSGKLWVQITDDAEPAYGGAVYLVISGDDAGKFTTEATDTLAIKAKWLGEAENGIAPLKLYDVPQA